MSRSKDNRAENITDLRQLRKERSRRRAWKRLGIFLGILLGAWLVVSGVQGFFSGTYIEDINSFLAMYLPGDGFPVEVTGSDVVSLQNAGGDLAVIGQNRVLYYNPNGRKVREIRHNLYNVDGTCYRSKTLLYDRGGNDLKVYSGEKELFSQNYAKSIYCAELSSSGSLAVATRSDTHTSQVTVYNDKFASIYEWYSAEGYVLDLCLPASGKVLAAATLEAQDGQLVSSVNLLDLTRKQETRRLDFTGEIIVDMAVSGGDQNLYVLTDKKFYEISLSAATVLNTYDFSAQGLWYYHFDEGIFTLVTGNYVEERSLNVVRLTPGFAEPRYAACTDHFVDVRSDSGHTYVLTDNELHVYDAQMQPEAVYDTPDASSLELIGDDVYYLTGSSLEKLSHQQQKEEE